MRSLPTRILLMVGVVIFAGSCSSVVPLSDHALAECTDVAGSGGTIGGSATLISTLVLRLPPETASTEGMSAEEIAAAFDAAFIEEYGIRVDEFLVLRDDADALTTTQLGEPPAVGEGVSDEWFVHRDVFLMRLWNERHPASARTVCALVTDEAREAP